MLAQVNGGEAALAKFVHQEIVAELPASQIRNHQ
jgi:hypothetical protein